MGAQFFFPVSVCFWIFFLPVVYPDPMGMVTLRNAAPSKTAEVFVDCLCALFSIMQVEVNYENRKRKGTC